MYGPNCFDNNDFWETITNRLKNTSYQKLRTFFFCGGGGGGGGGEVILQFTQKTMCLKLTDTISHYIFLKLKRAFLITS